jgi:hypothetical protein
MVDNAGDSKPPTGHDPSLPSMAQKCPFQHSCAAPAKSADQKYGAPHYETKDRNTLTLEAGSYRLLVLARLTVTGRNLVVGSKNEGSPIVDVGNGLGPQASNVLGQLGTHTDGPSPTTPCRR